jgi:hypothetical protein
VRHRPRAKEDGVERLGQVVFCAQLEAADDRLHLIEGRDHQHRDVAEIGIGLQLAQHYRVFGWNGRPAQRGGGVWEGSIVDDEGG